MAALYDNPVFRKIAGDSWHPGGIALTALALERCGFARNARLLDIGCGAGATLALLLAKGYDVIGLDRVRNCHSTSAFIAADAASPPFSDACFDGLICECVLSLLQQKQEALNQFSRILKPEGKILLSDIYARVMAPMRPNSEEKISCAAGAMEIKFLESMIHRAGLHIIEFSDHPEVLADFAARLVWHGCHISELYVASCRCEGVHAFGYGVWIIGKA